MYSNYEDEYNLHNNPLDHEFDEHYNEKSNLVNQNQVREFPQESATSKRDHMNLNPNTQNQYFQNQYEENPNELRNFEEVYHNGDEKALRGEPLDQKENFDRRNHHENEANDKLMHKRKKIQKLQNVNV